MRGGESPEIQSNKNLSINKQTDKQTKPETLIRFIPALITSIFFCMPFHMFETLYITIFLKLQGGNNLQIRED